MKIVMFSGGVGSRLWPLSRKRNPKQFGKIVGDKTMLQIVVQKLFPEFPWEDIYISTGVQYQDTVKDQLPDLPQENVIVEPEMRDVGPAVGYVIAHFAKRNPYEPIALLWGSDHLVKNEEAFRQALRAGERLIQEDPNKIIFIGQKPRFANQNLGYIEHGQQISQVGDFPIYSFSGFKYRPDMDVAKQFFESGHHAWNLGYFVTTPQFLWNQFEKFAPELFEKLKQIYDAIDTPEYEEVSRRVYPTIDKISFDNAILEKMDHQDAYVISCDIGWSDIGAWEALKEALAETIDENVTKGKVILKDSRDSLAFNYTNQLVVGIDMDEMLVVSTEDVIMVCPKDSVPKIKQLVEELNGSEHEHLT
jgi:mannose-1-phosphate guanylyltransferase